MEYTISQTEIARRKKAYLTLSASIMIGLVLASTILHFPVSIGGYVLVLFLIFLLGAAAYHFFFDLSRMQIYLSDQSLKRTVNRIPEEYILNKIHHVKVKWTTNKTVREMYIWLNDGKSVFITSLDRFEEFGKNLLAKLNSSVVVEEIHEPLDFDHPLFYSILGLPISFVGVFICKSIPSLSYQKIRIGIIAFFVYLFILGIYFITARPISKRSGNKTVTSDIITGILMICSGIITLLFFLNK
jgi:hypothetical protein